MLLYSIRNTQTGKFFTSTDWNGTEYWATSPAFWKTIDGVVENLKRIGSDYAKEAYHKTGRKAWQNFDAARLEHVEVVITDVKVLGETRRPAEDFVTEDVVR